MKIRIWHLAVGVFLFSASLGWSAEGFHPPEPYDVEHLYQQIKVVCPSKDWPCFEKQLFDYTAKYGPRGSIETFTLLQQRKDIDPNIDAHHFVHHIGHHTAMLFGSNSQAFALCPNSYNYGCLHGFFQHALGMGGTTEEKAAKICEDVEQNPTALAKTKFSCYHGLGHGIMMYQDHDLHASLKVCDSLKSPTGQDGCWQGVFMENVDVAEEGQWKKGLFSLTDPMAPCDHLAQKYQHECFINHSGWLMTFYKMNFHAAAEACLKAPLGETTTCLNTLGLLTTNPSWQPALLPGLDKSKFVENAWTLCQKFPDKFVDECVVSALDNILNSDTVSSRNVQTAKSFCNTVGSSYQSKCFSRMGTDLAYLTPDTKTAQSYCESLNHAGRVLCQAALPSH